MVNNKVFICLMFSRCQVINVYTDLVYSINSLGIHFWIPRVWKRCYSFASCSSTWVSWEMFCSRGESGETEGRCDLSKHLSGPEKTNSEFSFEKLMGLEDYIIFIRSFWVSGLLSGAILALRTLVKPNEQWKTNRLSSLYRGWTTTQL